MEKLFNSAQKLGITLNQEQLDKFHIFFQELIEWNKRFNLTHITEYEEVISKHFLDSLSIIAAGQLKDTDRVIDVGTGGGFPGLPLLIAYPHFKLVLLEATAKKVIFLKHITQVLGLSVQEIITDRAETVAHQPEYREQFDIVLSRAVAELPAAVELTLPFCKIGGVFIASKKGDITQEVSLSLKGIDILGGKLREIKPVTLKELPDQRQLVIIDKIKSTPVQYPRRPGMPEKKPIK
ncbi:MAG: 16S rRNA (guanine(527)-N(7))-methyltransferase RsmG [Dehalococcoidales bacterium]|nr:16S rRNA (guanine(527)-N(7))-methyltransferase RsmG [Dehalococcoidales bacterium]